MNFFVETLVGGLLAGVMYSLVAIGFVLVFKASGVFNFAQGSMVLCAALTFVTLREKNIDFWLAALITLAIMVAIAIAVERVVLRPLVNQPQITLFMATLGLSFVIEGLSQIAMGASVHELDLGIVDIPIKFGDIQVSQFDLVAGHRGCPGRRAVDLLQQNPRRHLPARHRRRPAGGTVDRHPAADPLADRLGRRRLRLSRGRPVVGIAPGRAVRAYPCRPQGTAGAHHRRIYVDHRRDRRRADRRRR